MCFLACLILRIRGDVACDLRSEGPSNSEYSSHIQTAILASQKSKGMTADHPHLICYTERDYVEYTEISLNYELWFIENTRDSGFLGKEAFML